jgi:hypothetical protein
MESNKKIKFTYTCDIIIITTQYYFTYIHHCVVQNITIRDLTLSYTIHNFKHTAVFSYMQLNPHISSIHKVVFLTAANTLLQK